MDYLRWFSGIIFLIIGFFSQPGSAVGMFEFLFQNRSSSSISSKWGESSVENSVAIVGGSEFGEICETNGKNCNEEKYLECINGKCLCKNPLQRAYDEDLKSCVSLSNTKCGGTKDPPCVRNSNCNFGACQCQISHSETNTKVCLLNRGENCGPNESCNGDKGLACIKGTCQCIDSSLIYKPFSNMCVNVQNEFDNFAKTVGRDVVQRVVAGTISRTVNDATRLASTIAFLPLRFLIPVIG